MKKKYIILFLLLVMVCMAGSVYANDPPADEETVDDGVTDGESTTDEPGGGVAEENIPDPGLAVDVNAPDHKITIAPWSAGHLLKATLMTTEGDVVCSLYAGEHPMTVLNFISLATGNPSWTDAQGAVHRTPYYENLAFSSRVKGAYVKSGLRSEGTDFVIVDERCKVHEPKKGAILMVQPHPGMASTQFVLLARDNPTFKGMYTVFGECESLDVIDKLTRGDAVLKSVNIGN